MPQTVIETRWEVLAILGTGVPPFEGMLDDLDRVFARPDLEPSELYYQHVEEFFTAAEDNPGQHAQTKQRRADAVAWALKRHGELTEWLQLSGLSMADAAEPAA